MLAEKLKEAREKTGMQKSDVAHFLGVTHARYVQIESGWSLPTVISLAKLSKLYNVSCDFLLEDFIKENEEDAS